MILAKVLLKAAEQLIRLATAVRRRGGARDVTLLLQERTALQKSLDAQAAALSLPAEPSAQSVLILIPFRDRWDLTHLCLESLSRQSLGALRVTIALVDNGSVEAVTLSGLAAAETAFAQAGFGVKRLRLDIPFNFSIIVNEAVGAFAGEPHDWLFLLNNDIEFQAPTDLALLVAAASTLPQVGAVSPLLLYPNGAVQHAFLAAGVKGLGAHPFKGKRPAEIARWLEAPRSVAALSGAALLMRFDDFVAEGGFDPELAENGQDLDFCLRLAEKGRVHWTLPSVRLTHHETASRTPKLRTKEFVVFADKWRSRITEHPLFSGTLTRWSEKPALRFGLGCYPWHLVVPARVPEATPSLRQLARAVRKKTFGAPLAYDANLAALTGDEPTHGFLRRPAGQFVYLYLTRFVERLLVEATAKQAAAIRVLDWGCGKGHVSHLLRERGLDVTSCDVRSEAADSSFGAQPTPLLVHAPIRVVPLDHAWVLPFEDAAFDAVMSFGVLEHVPFEFRSLREIWRVLVPGGLFVCTHVPSFFSWTQRLAHLRGNFYHDRLYTMNLIKALLAAADFELVDAWQRQLLPKNAFSPPGYSALERVDLFLTEHTPLKALATNLEFVARKPI